MKTKTWSFFLMISVFMLIIAVGCKKEKEVSTPELSTSPLSDITPTSVVSGGNILSDGGATVTARGVCWGIDPDPTIYGNITSDGSGSGSFLSSVKGLTSGVDYYMRAYATNIFGTAYGNEFIFILPLSDVDGNIYNTEIIGSQVWITRISRLQNIMIIH